MIFTNNILDDSESRCYYRLAFHPDRFAKLLLKERQQLIIYTLNLLSKDNTVQFSCDLDETQIGIVNDNEQLVINQNQIANPDVNQSLDLYQFLIGAVAKKYVSRRRSSSFKEEEIEIHRVLRKKIDLYINRDLEIIILHLMLYELSKLNELYLMNELSNMQLKEMMRPIEQKLLGNALDNQLQLAEQMEKGQEKTIQDREKNIQIRER